MPSEWVSISWHFSPKALLPGNWVGISLEHGRYSSQENLCLLAGGSLVGQRSGMTRFWPNQAYQEFLLDTRRASYHEVPWGSFCYAGHSHLLCVRLFRTSQSSSTCLFFVILFRLSSETIAYVDYWLLRNGWKSDANWLDGILSSLFFTFCRSTFPLNPFHFDSSNGW